MDVPFILKQGNGKRGSGVIVGRENNSAENTGNSDNDKTKEE